MPTILVADDRPHNREFLATLLGYRHHRVIQSEDGSQALALALSERPDLVISDILMPRMDGYELLRNLRASSELSRVPVVLWTAHYLEREARLLAQQSGAFDVLLKPADPEEVLRVVDAALEAPRQAAAQPAQSFDRQHLELVTNKLARKTDEAYWAQLRLQALVEAIDLLMKERDPERLIDIACRESRELIGSASSIIGIPAENGAGHEHCCIRGAETRLDRSFCGALRRSEAIQKMLAGQAPRRLPAPGAKMPPELSGFSEYPMESLLSVPLQSGGRTFGCLFLLNKVGAAEFSDEDERVALAFAGQIAQAFDNAQLYAEVTRLNTELTQFNQELRQYTKIAFHHLQEPLRSIQGFSQLLAAKYAGRLDSAADEFLTFIQQGAVRMRSLIQDLGEYARLNSPEDPRRTAVALSYAAREARTLCADAIARTRATVDIAELPIVKGDEPQLRQVFLHLLQNALKFRSSAPPSIEVRAEDRDGLHLIAVKDNGIGIEPRYHQRIFNIFERLQTDSQEGTGMGLALCRKIVERHGGSMWVESDGAAGSTFYFTLPRFPAGDQGGSGDEPRP